MKHVTNMCVDVTQPDTVLGIGSLVVEKTASIFAFIEKMNTNIHVIPVNAYPLFTKKMRALSA